MGLIAYIYNSDGLGNCSNNGISARFKRVVIVNAGGPFDPSEEMPAVEVKSKFVSGEYLYAVPLEEGEGAGPMMGGSFIWSSDGRFPSKYPIPLHDRWESWELNRALSA